MAAPASCRPEGACRSPPDLPAMAPATWRPSLPQPRLANMAAALPPLPAAARWCRPPRPAPGRWRRPPRRACVRREAAGDGRLRAALRSAPGRGGGAMVAALFCGALAALVLLGVRDVLFLYEENRCSMTYMYEYPEYLKIKLPKKIARRYPAYELYLYGEGNYAEENKNLLLTGIPVLFLPGNAGSYKQVRSLGSIALRKAEDVDFKYHFNFFSVNFNEELVALYGGSLQRQTKFVHECIKVILKLYRGREFAPTSVAIVGHSMGGLIARALLTLKNFKPELINLLITQATPHVAPVMPLDKYLTDFYTAVNNHWILKAQDLRNLTTLSVAGGFRDYQVRSGLAFLPRSSQHDSALSVVSSAVPRAWASTDHLSIVWCKELILATIRAFFDLIDENTRQITEDPKKRMSVLNHHFVRHPAKIFEENPEAFTELTGAFMWITVKASKWTYSVYNDSDGKYFTFPLASHRKSYSHVYCENSMLDTSSWIFGCMNNNSSMCLEATDLSWRAELLPTTKVVILKLQDYPSLSHIVIQVPPTVGNKYTLGCEFFKEGSRTVQLPVTHLFSFGLSSSKILLNSTGLLYNVQLQHFNQIYQAFKIYIESHCQSFEERKPSVYRLHIPWSHEDSVTVAKVPSSTEISAKLHIAQPKNDSRVPELNIYSSSDCQYEVVLKTSLLQVLGQIIRFHGGALPVYIVSNILLTYGGQLSTLISTGQCSDFSLELVRTAKPYKVEPLISIVVFLQGFNWFREIWESLSLPEVEAAVLSSQDAWFPLVSLILFLFGTGIAYWSGVFFSTSLRLFSSLWLTLMRPTVLQKDKLITPRRLCGVLSLAVLSWTTCGAVAVFIIYLQYLFKVIKLHVNVRAEQNMLTGDSDHSKETSQNSRIHTVKNQSLMDSISEATQSLPNSTTAEAVNSLKIHITILNLLTWIVLLNLPSLIYWLKNLRYNVRLDPDPCRSTAIIIICILEILMNSSALELKSSKLLKIAAKVPLPLSVAMLAFGRMHLYKVPHFVTFSLLLHVLCCIV
ncbi:GPI inositol-deacylase isoform X1 [Falco cherrug]|uniref:GPI inositol-deacylase isoform X1 n=3 Tax=Falco cherrug TaxID=345164 RepID=UPI0024791F14|nr:GPI inositol-deacylase isoform X1 [Falco cherrug]